MSAGVSNNLERDVRDIVETESQARELVSSLSKESNPHVSFPGQNFERSGLQTEALQRTLWRECEEERNVGSWMLCLLRVRPIYGIKSDLLKEIYSSVDCHH